ncbi:MAG: nucleotidyltransferase domain-containing protein, partial [Clostridia bacterium]|nr:nucleotidyltransferase domain-containing protein [Clostridia bacterium]
MIDVKTWIKEFTNKVEQTFSNRVWFIGLQGSYGRGEATQTSDIDAVVILDELRINDLKVYRDMLDTLPNRELICGFISGKDELLNCVSLVEQYIQEHYKEPLSLDVLAERVFRTP